jgi:hypothetical protein
VGFLTCLSWHASMYTTSVGAHHRHVDLHGTSSLSSSYMVKMCLQWYFSEEAQAANVASGGKNVLDSAIGALTKGLSARCVDDYEIDKTGTSVVHLLLEGKIAQATLLAWKAYDTEEVFRKETGLTNAKLLSYEPLDTQASFCMLCWTV